MMQITPLSGITSADWLKQLDPRVGLISVFLVAFCLVTVNHFHTVFIAFLIVIGVLFSARLPLRPVAKRLLAFEGFILVLVLFLPFSMTSVVPDGQLFGVFDYHQTGIDKALLIFFRANAIVILTLILIATKEPEQIGHAFARLGMPDKLVQLFLMTTRYVAVLAQEYRRLRNAMRARAFQPSSNLHSWRSYGWLLGMLLVRSLERSGRVLDAMRCRGYQGKYAVLDSSHWRRQDTFFLMFVIMTVAGLVFIDRFVLEWLEFTALNFEEQL